MTSTGSALWSGPKKSLSTAVLAVELEIDNQNHSVLRLRGGGGGYGDEDDGSTSTRVEEEGSIIIGDPVGLSFDDTSTDSCDLQIAEECEIGRKVIEALNTTGEEDVSKTIVNSDVYDFFESEKTLKSSKENKFDKNEQEGVCCNSLCNQKEISLQLRSKLDEINQKSKKDVKQFLLDHLYSQEDMGLSTHGFQFFGILFCKKSFLQISGLSDYLVTEVCKAFEFGQSHFIHGNETGLRESEATRGFLIWMKQHAENYGNQSPEDNLIIIPACFSIKDLFEQYESEAPAPLIKSSTFYRLFSSKFGPYRSDKSLPHVRISSYSSHSKCDHCLSLERFQRSCKTEQDLEFAKALKQTHKQTYRRAYNAIQEKRFKAIYDPDNYLFIQIDDMDNHKVGGVHKCFILILNFKINCKDVQILVGFIVKI